MSFLITPTGRKSLSESVSAKQIDENIDKTGDDLEAAHARGQLQSALKKAKTSHLMNLHKNNMGYSGASQHPITKHIGNELKSRGKPVSESVSAKQIDENIDKTGDDLEAAHAKSPSHLQSALKKARTSHLMNLHKNNMGYSGASQHPITKHIGNELKSRGKPVSESVIEESTFALHAVRGDTGSKKHLGDFKSKADAAKHVDSLEDKGKFPEGHDAVLTHKNTGEKHLYTDRWEKA